jgi:hypothetical protein
MVGRFLPLFLARALGGGGGRHAAKQKEFPCKKRFACSSPAWP